MIRNEEEIRTKVVIPWLESHGFSKDQIIIESSFNIHLGRNSYKVDSNNFLKNAPKTAKPRIDVLVKDSNGKNLFVIEVKGPEVPLNDNSYKQSISYGRLLESGGIAPYVITTNGKDTKVYFTLTGEEVTKETIRLKGFDFSFSTISEDIKLKNDALLQLITLNNNNFLKFAELQVSERMARLYSESILSWEKYIPQLYVNRDKEEQKLREHIKSNKRVVLITAQPQIGKTNFLCHMACTMLKEGSACLFFPSIGMTDSLINSMASDFCWQGIDNNSPIAFINNNIQRITQTQKIIIFLDGLNEISSDLIARIGEDASKLHNLSVTFVISCTWSAIRRVLNDKNNAHYFLRHLNVDRGLLERIDVESNITFNDNTPIIELNKFDDVQSRLAFQKYSSEFDVNSVSFKQEYSHPYSLRLAMQYLLKTGSDGDMDIHDLLKVKILDKAERCMIFEYQSVFPVLTSIVEEMIKKRSSSVDIGFVSRLNLLKSTPYNQLFDSGILAQFFTDKAEPRIIFYDEMERDFLIALYHFKLDEIDVQNTTTVLEEHYELYVASSAIRWFCGVSVSFCEKCIESIDSLNSDVCSFVISAVRKNTKFDISDDKFFWLFNELLAFSSPRLIAELLHWGFELEIEFNDLIESIDEEEQGLFMQGLLSIETEEEKLDGYIQSIMEQITFSHYRVANDEYEHSAITSTLFKIASSTSNPLYVLAGKFLANINYRFFLQIFEQGNINKQEGINEIANIIMVNLNTQYFGDMCPGMLNIIEDSETAHYYYEELLELYPFMARCTSESVLEDYSYLLNTIKMKISPTYVHDTDTKIEVVLSENTDQLKFKF